MTESKATKKGTLFSPELVTDIMSKVTGHSTLAKLSTQQPIPFSGAEQFVFNLDVTVATPACFCSPSPTI